MGVDEGVEQDGRAYVRTLDEVGAGDRAAVGGKGANLGELRRLDGVRVPPGFCVTTDAFAAARAKGDLEVPPAVAAAIAGELERLGGPGAAYAVRSSATAEDLPTASFAGQHDSTLDVVGADAVLEAVVRCWASLTGEHARAYRRREGLADEDVRMAVVVQRMVAARAAGVLFTADPVSGHRRVVAIEAVPGRGDALVSGRAPADAFRVRDGRVVAREVRHAPPTLTDGQAVELARLGRVVEAALGAPQDIEWCLDDEGFALVQSRPITTLYPVPDAGDDAPHVYISVGHQQMMTDPMKALGLSLWQLLAMPRMYEAGGRLFVDVAPRLASTAAREATVRMLGQGDPLIGDALRTVLERDDLLPPPADGPAAPALALTPPGEARETPPATAVGELVARGEAGVDAARRALDAVTGPAVFDALRADVEKLRAWLFDPVNIRVIMVAMEAAAWLDEQLEAWLGERGGSAVLSRSVPGNITSEMGLELLDVADVCREHPGVVAFLEGVEDDAFLERLDAVEGGPRARVAIEAFLDRHGVRCVGEIDITRPRWSERPSALVPALLGNVRSFAPGAGPRRFERGRAEAEATAQELLARVRELPDGASRAQDVQRNIDVVRTFSGFREYPKYGIVRHLAVYKDALLREASRLVEAGVLLEVDDCFHLTLDELEAAVREGRADPGLIAARRAAHAVDRTRRPPRVLTSDGEAIAGTYRRDDVPDGALVGLAVSGGTVEGRARVVHDLDQADLGPGDILVTRFTDPSWTPLFVAVAGLVTEVGGRMTHGAVIAREYGLPAVVAVPDATRLIEDGRRIRVHGTDGIVELL